MKTLKTYIGGAVLALAVMAAMATTAPKAKANSPHRTATRDGYYPNCNESDHLALYGGASVTDPDGNYMFWDLDLGSAVCNDPDPTGGIGDIH